MTGIIDPIATFLSHVEPWASGTYINIEAYDWVPKPGGKPGEGTLSKQRGSRAARDLQEAVSFIRWQDGQGREVYIRMGSVKNPGTGKVDKLGRTFHRALSGQANAAMAKSFYIDVDVKPGKHASTQEAQAAVAKMCAAINLPLPSLAVASGGGGFHAHWVLDKPIAISDWEQIAPMLAEACRRNGVHADHNLTVNPVCLLRIPGTHNRKYGAPRPVTMQVLGPAVDVDRIIVALIPYHTGPLKNSGSATPGVSRNDSLDLTKFKDLGPVDLAERWTDGISSAAYTIKEVAAGCPHIKETLETGGKGQHEPLWFDAAHVALFTAGGLEDFHKLSEGHGSYTNDETDAKFAQVLKSKREKNLGWPRCQTFHNDGATKCGGCPHLKHNKSPLNFAVHELVTPTGSPDDPQGPGDSEGNLRPPLFSSIAVEGYTYDPVNGVYSHPVIVDKKTGETADMAIHTFPIHDLQYMKAADGRWAVHFDTWMAKREPVHIVLHTKQETDDRAIRDCLSGDYGLSVHPDAGKELRVFMAAFKDQMRRTTDNIARQERMGWAEEDGKPVGFIYGKFKYNCKGNTPYYQGDHFIKQTYSPTGSIDPWMEAIRMVNAEQRPEMDFLVATAFGAPLMRFSSEKGVVISAFSSGTAAHKTTALKVGQAVWGAFEGINQLSDTENSLIARIGKSRIVPTYFDEMKSSLDIKKFASIIYTFAGGRSKSRMSRTIELRSIDTWDTLLVGVSNDSLFDYVAHLDQGTDAGVARIFEFEIAPPDPNSPGQIAMGTAGTLLKKLEGNYGRAGERYAEHLGQSVEWLPERVHDTLVMLQKQLNAPSSERFWVAAAAVQLLGAQMANDINLARFDVGRMSDFIVATFARLRTAQTVGDLDISKKDSVKAILASYLNTHRRSILATDTAGTAGRVGAINHVTILNGVDVHSAVSEFTVRYIKDTNTLRISRPAMIKWLTEQRLSPGVFLKKAKELYGGRDTTLSLLGGTGRGSSPERVIELDLNRPDLAGFYDFS